MAFVHTVRKLEHHNVHSSGIVVDEFRDKGFWEWTKSALKSIEEAMESYMVEVIAKVSF
jgi:hypothetical protein